MKQSNTIRSRTQRFISNLSFHYDNINDLLYVYKKNSSIYSNVIIGDFHLEFDRNCEVIGVEVLNASDILKEYDIPKKILENIERVNLKVVTRGSSLLVFLLIYSMKQEKSATITMNNLEAPLMQAITSA